MFIVKCDKCGKTSEPYKGYYNSMPNEWKEITYNMVYQQTVKYQICPDCVKALKIEPEKIYTQSVGDRLLEIIEEIVHATIPSN